MGIESGRGAIDEGLRDHAEQVEDKDKISDRALELAREVVVSLPTVEQLKTQILEIMKETKIVDKKWIGGKEVDVLIEPESDSSYGDAGFMAEAVARDIHEKQIFEAINRVQDKLSREDYLKIMVEGEGMPHGVYRAIHWDKYELRKFDQVKKLVEEKLG